VRIGVLTEPKQTVRRRKSKGQNSEDKRDDSPKLVWPPLRKHHQLKATEKEKAQKQRHLTPEQQWVSTLPFPPVYREQI
jgi:hypothetical protein